MNKRTVYEQPFANLSPREIEVYELHYQGLRSRDIAERLGISRKTVEQHMAHARQKFHRAGKEYGDFAQQIVEGK